jgi:hypothetical protein
LGRLSISSDCAGPKADEAILLLDADVPDGREFVELDPLNDGTELALPREEEEDVAAIGVETLFAWIELDIGRAMVTGGDCWSAPLAFNAAWN